MEKGETAVLFRTVSTGLGTTWSFGGGAQVWGGGLQEGIMPGTSVSEVAIFSGRTNFGCLKSYCKSESSPDTHWKLATLGILHTIQPSKLLLTTEELVSVV